MDWLQIAKTIGCVDIGQIPNDQLRQIKSAVKRGELIHYRAAWCGMITKNHYAAPELLPEYLQKTKT